MKIQTSVGRTIDWNQANRIRLTRDEFLEKLQSLDTGLMVKPWVAKNSYIGWAEYGAWRLDKINDNLYSLMLHQEYGDTPWYIYTCDIGSDKINNNYKEMKGNVGRISWSSVNDKMKEAYPAFTMRSCFGSDTDAMFYRYICKPFYYLNQSYCGMVHPHVSYADFCSQYPTNLCGALPHLRGMKIVDGRVAPNRKYPFAFYPDTCSLAEWDVQKGRLKYDTLRWRSSPFIKCMLSPEQIKLALTKTDTKTILLKPAKYKLDYAMNYFYNKRKEDPRAKLVMNSFIGFLHQRGYDKQKIDEEGNVVTNAAGKVKYEGRYKYAHIAAVVLARANQRMLDLIDKVGAENVIQIAVDGCIYMGKEAYGVEEKKLGNLHQECVDEQFRIIGVNQYAFWNPQIGFHNVRHGAFNAGNFDNMTSFNDMDTWHKDRTLEEKLKSLMEVIHEQQDKAIAEGNGPDSLLKLI